MQGDVLSGALAVMVSWALEAQKDDEQQTRSSLVTAAFAASLVTRYAQKAAFEKHRRSMLAQDVINELGSSVDLIA